MLSANDYAELNALITGAMKDKNADKLRTLKLIKADMVTAEKNGTVLTEESELKLLMKMAQSRKDSIQEYKAAGRDDLVESEQYELDLIRQFLPEEASEEDIIAFTTGTIKAYKEEKGDSYALSMKDMGQIMKTVRAKYPTVDGNLVKKTLQSFLGI